MPTLLATTLTLAAAYGLLVAIRLGLALRYVARPPYQSAILPDKEAVAVADVTVLQAILSGDPLLEDALRRNLCHHPETHFIWLIDETDAEGRRIATRLVAEAPAARIRIWLTPPVPQGINPKSFKLSLALPEAGPIVVVLDDDTVLLPGALAHACGILAATDGLVTGLPYYTVGTAGWSRLVMAFVNANALLTYLPPLFFQLPATINGMFYATRQRTLQRLGGFAAIEAELCDDYALAQLYRRQGLPVVQSTIMHPLATSVPSLGSYLQLMRRWMVFARRLFRSSLSLPVVVLVVVPSTLPLILLVLSLLSTQPGLVAAVLGVLLLKASILARVRRRLIGTPESLGTVVLEVVADLLQPLHLLHALLQPRRVQWRDKSIELVQDGLRYV